MKLKFGLLFATMLSTAVLAQPPLPEAAAPTTAAPEATAPATPAPTPPDAGAKPAKKKAAKKKTVAKKAAAKPDAEAAPAPAPLMTNEMAVAIARHVVVRGQAHINSEIVGHLKKGDTVTVLEIVTLKHPATDEPAKWARIALPADMHAWADTSFIDASSQTVSARKLNVRTGPGENYSIVGLLHKGDAVKTVTNKGSWTEIEPPANAFAFVAAHLLAPAPAAPPVTPEPIAATPVVTPVPTPVETSSAIAPPASGTPGAPVTSAVPPPVPIAVPLPPVAPPVPAVEQPLPVRVVEREGVVGGAVSIQAPSHYELKNLENGRTMDYLYTTSTNLMLKRYKGLTVVVSGEEELDERWPNTPVITIQKIQVVK